MKKLFATAASLCVLAAAMAAPVSADSQNQFTMPVVPDGSIVIDSERDALYDNCEGQTMNSQNLDRWEDSPMNSQGTFWAVCDSEYIYVYVDMEDLDIDYSNEDPEETWNRESIGVIFDFSYIRDNEYEYSYEENGDKVCYINLSGDGYVVTYHMYADDADTGLYEKISYATNPQTNGNHILYELKLPIPEGVDMSEGVKFGFEICAPNAEFGERAGVVSWSPDGDQMWKWTSVCGTAIVGAPVAAEDDATAGDDVVADDNTASDVVADPADDGAANASTTADAGIVVAAAVMVAAAGIVVSKKH